MVKLVREQDESLVKEIDKDIRNKFRWSWLEKTVTFNVKIGKKFEAVTEKLADYVAKCDLPGKAQCLYCNDIINYGSRGCVSLIDHATKNQKHAEKTAIRRTNYSLGSAFKKTSTPTINEGQIQRPTTTPESRPLTSISDRRIQSEEEIMDACALVLGVVAEHSLPLSMAPVILDTARELAKDPKALNHMSLERTTSSYKMRFGLGKTFQDETVQHLRTTPFSLNIDESTSNSDKRVLAILASFYSEKRGAVVVEHLSSIEVIRVDAESLFNVLDNLFKSFEIPWTNVVSILMDSCSVMRGSKNGLETKIRNRRAPQLLDIDGDSCHHIHNACKQFSKPFDNWVEHLQSDLHNDVKWSPDLRQYLEEICHIMGIKFTMPERFVNHRWLSCFDACSSNILMIPAFKVFYFSFLEANDQALFRETTLKLAFESKASSQGVKRIKEIWGELQKKKLTEDGKRRKSRIAEKIIIQEKKTMLIMHFFLVVLPLLKQYVLLFQSSEPLIHLLHEQQEQVFRDFLSCFVKAECLVGKSAKQLKSMNLESDEGQFLDILDMFVGKTTKELMKSSHKNDTVVSCFLKKAAAAYMLCARHLQKRLPLNNKLLWAISSLDPVARGHSQTIKAMTELGEQVKTFLTDEEQESLPMEIHKFQVDLNVKAVDNEDRIDAWWQSIIEGKKYPAVSKMAKICLSCFHGPRVESSFNTMGDIIDIRSTRMNTKTFSAIQTVKYGLKSRQTTSLDLFKKKDVKHDTIDPNLCVNFKTAASAYTREKDEKKQKKEKELEVLRSQQQAVESRAAQKREQQTAANVARLAHVKAQKRKAAERLQALVAKRKKVF